MTHTASRAGTTGPLLNVREQIALLVGLRWRIFRNSLGTRRGRFELAAQVVLAILLGTIALGIGIGLGLVGYVTVATGKVQRLVLLLSVIFFGWQLLTVILSTSELGFDFRNLLRFPLRFPTFFLLHVCSAAFDPVALTGLFSLFCLFVGVRAAKPEVPAAAGWAFLALVLFALVNLLLGKLILSWLERLLARQRSRELLGVAVVVAIVGLQVGLASLEKTGKRAERYARRALEVAYALPPGLAANTIMAPARGEPAEAAASALALAAYGAGFALLLGWRLRAQYLGEDLGEAPALPATLAGGARVRPGWHVPGLAPKLAAVLEKELRYMFRTGPQVIAMVIPLLLVVLFATIWSMPRQRPSFLTRSPEMLFPTAIAYAFLILTPQLHNVLAFDGHGVQLFFVAPVRFRDVLLAKNLAYGCVVFAQAVIIWAMVSALAAPPGGELAAATFAALLFATLVHFIVGNLLSLYFPRAFDFEHFRQRNPGATILGGLGLQIVVMGLVGGMLAWARWSGKLWLATVNFLVLAGLALVVYASTLEHCSQLAADRREVLTRELCK